MARVVGGSWCWRRDNENEHDGSRVRSRVKKKTSKNVIKRRTFTAGVDAPPQLYPSSPLPHPRACRQVRVRSSAVGCSYHARVGGGGGGGGGWCWYALPPHFCEDKRVVSS